MIRYCSELNPIKVSTHLLKKKCGYCKSGREVYDKESLLPKDFCIDAYYAAYPYLLALLYDAKFNYGLQNKDLIVSCPNANNPALIKISFESKKFKTLINLLEKLFRMLGFPKDAIDKIIQMEIVNENKQCKLVKGHKFNLRIPQLGELCPASFFSFYPLIHLYRSGNLKIVDDAQYSKICFACPDPKTNINYHTDFSLERNHSAKLDRPMPECLFFVSDLSRYKIVALNDNKCKFKFSEKKEIELDKISATGLCPYIFNIAIPYMLTLQNGGYFKWRKDKNSVEAQCPNSESGVEFEIKKESADTQKISLVIKKIRGSCINKHQKGQVYHMDFSKIICPHLFVRLFPSLLQLEYERGADQYREGIILKCPLQNDAEYLLTKRNSTA